jgi:hypothetical protein
MFSKNLPQFSNFPLKFWSNFSFSLKIQSIVTFLLWPLHLYGFEWDCCGAFRIGKIQHFLTRATKDVLISLWGQAFF